MHICSRAFARSENPGGNVILGGDDVPPLVEIGITDLTKKGRGMCPPAPPPPRLRQACVVILLLLVCCQMSRHILKSLLVCKRRLDSFQNVLFCRVRKVSFSRQITKYVLSFFFLGKTDLANYVCTRRGPEMFFFLWVLLLRVPPSRVIKSNQPMPVLFLRRSLKVS